MNRDKNILFIIVDQLRADALSCYGNRFVETPALDGLAAEGVLFKSCTIQASPCGPSRACLMTGTYLHRNRSIRNEVPLVKAGENWGAWLRETGRRPVLIGNHDYSIDPSILPEDDERRFTFSYHNTLPGFDTELYHESYSPEYEEYLVSRGYGRDDLSKKGLRAWCVPSEGSGDRWERTYPAVYEREESETFFITDRAIDFVKRNSSGEAWTLNLNIYKPHAPEICPEPYHDKYDPQEMVPPFRSEEELSHGHPYLRKMMKQDNEEVNPYWKEQRALYHGMVSEVDDNLNRLFETLKETDQWANTLIIFTSDHGAYNGDHWMNDKGHYFDSALQVPLIIRDPSGEFQCSRNTIVNDLVSSVDIVPTLLDILGMKIPARVQGRSLISYLDGTCGEPRNKSVFSEFDYSEPLKLVTGDEKRLLWIVKDRNYKYVEFADPDYRPLFFDLQTDPGELENLSEQEKMIPLMWEYSRKLLRWRMQNEDRSMTDLMAETIESQK
ncbi:MULTISPECIES: sulfatase-like hydrolase/transferase [unclassified Oceanispirochaeta]|uniref:sulfatase-like hydrolase/transferase n=1 Tax=unclassified Oceanispirochaeta TaxID=2635722 RepID=UPI0013145CBB|nr:MULTISPECIES: sulfatase-like hydrolase/transferase [unclassified Oceanispirochaeta]MBF9018646.1 sulfatase-like hydrolase/transferase [Oceanispirochaeta sp. M2]NPD75083.1 sulfatase-like hydrolase/transferase [Oceanispirochaeta sp. M1]